MRIPRAAVAIITTCLICASAGCWSPVYRIDINQGNAVEEDEVNKVEVGMTPAQVRFILGNPLVHDGFHDDRWDYLHYVRKGKSGKVTRSHLVIYFKDGRVSQIDRAEVLPTPKDKLKKVTSRPEPAPAENGAQDSKAPAAAPAAESPAAQSPQANPEAPPAAVSPESGGAQPDAAGERQSQPADSLPANQPQAEPAPAPEKKPGFFHRLIWPEKKPKSEPAPDAMPSDAAPSAPEDNSADPTEPPEAPADLPEDQQN